MACAADEIKNTTNPVRKEKRESFNPAFPKNDFWNRYKKKDPRATAGRRGGKQNWIKRDEIICHLFPVSADKIVTLRVYQMNVIFGEKG
jgi:hypothetical protein